MKYFAYAIFRNEYWRIFVGLYPKKMKNPSFLFLILLFRFGLLAGQDPDPEAIYLRKSSSVDIDILGGELKVNEHHFSEKAFYKNFEKHSRESIFYSDFDPVTTLDALTLVPEKSGYKKLKVSTIETKDIVQPGIFYGGYKRRDFVFPMLMNGAIGRLQYSKVISDVHLLSPFYFNDDILVRTAEYSVTFPQNVKLRYKLFGAQKDNIRFTEKTNGNKIIYTWTLSNVPAYKDEDKAPPRPYIAPHIIIHVDSYESKGLKRRVLSDVSDLYRWYDGLVKQIPAENNAALRSTVDELTKNAKTETEKIKAIFQWVQTNIKYVAFENGMAGFIPRASSDVYNKRYGDCKDMANLLKDLLVLAGIEAHHTWIGTRSRPYTYEDVPTAIADDHMICSVKTPEGYIFLDATNPFLTFGKPSSMIQNKEALIGISSDKYEVVTVPVVKRSDNKRVDTLAIRIEPDGLRGEFASELTGFRKDQLEINHLKAAIRNEREYIRDFFTIGGNNIGIEKLSIAGLGDQNAPAKIRFSFVQPGYYKTVGDKIYVNLNLNKSLPGEKLDITKREHVLEEDYHYEDHSISEFTIPDGFQPGFIPSTIEKKWEHFGAMVNYRTEANKIIMEKMIYSEFLYLNKDKFLEWNEFLELLNKINQQSVTLTKK
jgi:hypothetical protein